MTTADQTASGEAEQRLAAILADPAAGRFPPPDGVVEILPVPTGPVDAVVAFTAHHLVAADVDPDWVRARLDADDDVGAPMRAAFLAQLGERLGAAPGTLDVVLAASGGGHRPELELAAGGEPRHPRVGRARRYRRGVRCYEDRRGGLLTVGRGLAGRVEVSIEVDEPARGRGRGLALARAALGLVEPGEAVFAQVSPGNVASLRCLLAAGYRPVSGEVLFMRTARRRLGDWPTAEGLESPRLGLEPLAVRHAEEMAPLLDDPELHVFIGGRPATIPELRHRYGRQAAGRSPDGRRRWCNWIVRRRHDGLAVGTMQDHHRRRRAAHRRGGLGDRNRPPEQRVRPRGRPGHDRMVGRAGRRPCHRPHPPRTPRF